ncbi:DUF4340 domain-containing protein [Marinoscillum sp. MHG1-6]|uniref:DUF4340 domain-containing protein n=1 Tax=Marinoscillum sp. MHG1-6 TaxID=2959627 RepID=UPI0021576262|nr:DUF4340 domain-containing protein [Marinoscillum sp. MHG1-6]
MLKGNKTVILLGVLILLVAIYGVVKLTSDGGRSKSYKEQLVDLDTAAVTRVEIVGGQEKLILEKKDAIWWVKDNKKAQSTTVRSMLMSLNGIKPSRIAARSKEKWSDFQVDSAGTRVKVYEGGDEVLDLIIGRFGVEGQRNYFTYVRLADDEDTYVANDFMGMSIGKTDADYRNNRILKITADSVQSVDFVSGGQTYSLIKTEEEWGIGGVSVEEKQVKDFLGALSYVTSKKFEDGEVTADGNEVIFHLTTGDISVKSFGESSFSSSSNDEIFTDPTVYEKIFKQPDFFLNQ